MLKNSSPAVSVIIPAYGHADYILDAIQSVRRQTFQDFEIIVINDGSPDDTRELLKPLADRQTIRYYEQKNQGQSVARNRGLGEARGQYIALLDDDDLWPENKLEWQVRLLEQNEDAVLVYGGVTPFSDAPPADSSVASEQAPNGDVMHQFARRNWIVSPGQTLIRKVAIMDANGFDASIWGADDYDLYLSLAKHGTFLYRHVLALFYRKHEGNASHQVDRLYRNTMKVRQKHRQNLDHSLRGKLRDAAYVRKYFSVRFCSASVSASLNGEFVPALRLVTRGILIWPPGILRRRVWKAFGHLAKTLLFRDSGADRVVSNNRTTFSSDSHCE